MKPIKCLAAGCTTLILAAASLLLSPAADADTLPSPDAVFQAWNDSFLVTANGETYYTDELKSKGTERAGTWIAALDIMVAQDVYQRTHAPADRQRVSDLVTTFIKHEGTTWTSWDSWNDDIAWMETAVLRGYQATGNADWLNTAVDQWNKAYNRGWTSAGGGGIWEDQGSLYSKCSLSNNPMVSTAVSLYQITGDGTYLTKAEAIYDWVRKNLVNTSSGVVNECIAFPNGVNGSTTLQASDNAYNAGSFIEAADNLYRVTGNSQYHDDAQRTADHFLNTVPIVANNQEKGSSYQYWLFKGISDFCTDANLCSRYDAYMRSNAAQAWSERNSANLTWNDWTKPTNDANPDAFEMNGMVGLFQVLPTTAASPFSGDYQLQNVTSTMSLGIQGDSTANSAAVVQNTDTGDSSASWSFVPESNGYYEIKNTRSGQLLNVSGGSGKPGALIVQWPAGGIQSGNDQWLPVRNSDGTYSFYNRNSQLALDDPSGSTSAGTQFDQWPQNDSSGQKFTVISRTTGTGPTGPTNPTGSGAVKSGVAGKCLDLNAGNATNGTAVQLWTCNGSGAQSWTATSTGTLQTAGKCLDAVGQGTANGTKTEIWDCNGGTNQVWQAYNGGYRNPASGRCLDDPAASSTDGTQLQLYDCNGSAAQIWSMPGA
jgi:Glycosyl hydrolase family 76/Ricin-type beta-trefoil lectin domain/Ricin-type beta-trefoil lectin domain-like